MASYNYKDIEAKWQKKWEESGLYATRTTSNKKKWYGLVEFPYPSGAGLHVGHVRSYTAMDILSRKRRRENYEVLFPIGWDAFGLPAENYAIKTGIHPSIVTQDNINNFRRQLKACGFSFDWAREVDTTDPKFYKWSQWIFLKLYEKGLAYKKKMLVNWCPKDKCVLANEEVVDGACERCGTVAEKREKEQWMLAITKYAERLDKDLDDTQYLEKIKIQQRNWIGLSEGSEINFTIALPAVATFKFEERLVDDIKNGTKYSTRRMDSKGVKIGDIISLLDNNGGIFGFGKVTSLVSSKLSELELSYPGGTSYDDKDAQIKSYREYYGDAINVDTIFHTIDFSFINSSFTVFTTRADTLFGCTYTVLAPEHQLVNQLITAKLITNSEEATSYAVGAKMKKDIDRSAEGRKKTGVKLEGIMAINPGNKEEVPVFIADYVLPQYGTGAIMAVPAHDGRDYEFAIEYSLPIKCVVIDCKKSTTEMSEVENSIGYQEDGVLINSGKYNGVSSKDARQSITKDVDGTVVTKSKLRDWVFARQRYWGEPIPLVYDANGKMYPVHESNLPVTLPQVEKYEPTDNGESPLYQVPEWVNVTGYIDDAGYFHQDITKAELFRRETDTMPQWAGSSWYFMRYIDPKNDTAIGDKELLSKWLSVDWYNGGMEHTTLHLLYSRFWYKFLFDIGVVPTSEPYYKRTSQGMILGEGGIKMSKSLGNTISPDGIIDDNGADTLRLYEMFIGPFDQQVAWNSQAISGVKRFLDKVYTLKDNCQPKGQLLSATHQAIKKVTEDIESMSFNTCVSQMMILANTLENEEVVGTEDYLVLITLLAPFAPHITEEIWESMGNTTSVHSEKWPTFDPEKLLSSTVTMAIQIAGKMRGTVEMPRDEEDVKILESIKTLDIYSKYVGSVEPKKIIIVKNKIVNIVI